MKTVTESSKGIDDGGEHEIAPLRVQSPCIKMCRLDDKGFCISCGRTLEQIINWRHYSQEQKLNIVNDLKINFKIDERRKRR